MILATVALAMGLLQSAHIGVSAEAFVRHLYEREAHATRADEEAFGGHRGAETIYSPSLLALIRQDRRNSSKGDVGRLDYDPICGCQDPDGISIQTVKLVSITHSTAKLSVRLHFGGADRLEITLKLVRLPEGWRVDDVDGPEVYLSGSFLPRRSKNENRLLRLRFRLSCQ